MIREVWIGGKIFLTFVLLYFNYFSYVYNGWKSTLYFVYNFFIFILYFIFPPPILFLLITSLVTVSILVLNLYSLLTPLLFSHMNG
jgi:hypothetical protein